MSNVLWKLIKGQTSFNSIESTFTTVMQMSRDELDLDAGEKYDIYMSMSFDEHPLHFFGNLLEFSIKEESQQRNYLAELQPLLYSTSDP